MVRFGRALCHACDRRATPTPSRADWPAGQDGDRRISAYLSFGAAFLNGTPSRAAIGGPASEPPPADAQGTAGTGLQTVLAASDGAP